MRTAKFKINNDKPLFQIMQTQKQVDELGLVQGKSFKDMIIVRVEYLLPSGYRKIVLQ